VHKKRRTAKVTVEKASRSSNRRERDLLVVEEPLTILWQALDGPGQKLAATMRTPGDDNELAAGMLFSEGLILQRKEIETLSFCTGGSSNLQNRLQARLRIDHHTATRRLSHRPSQGIPQSACGLCSFDDLADPATLVRWALSTRPGQSRAARPKLEVLKKSLACLRDLSPIFAATGASHATALISSSGEPIVIAEDVGRHNACDKALGKVLLACKTPQEPFALPEGTGILFSSRLSFELACKAVRAGAAWMASVGAPTHLSIELASACGLPTYGFLSDERHNVYV
jgi:FdhD protein